MTPSIVEYQKVEPGQLVPELAVGAVATSDPEFVE
jgi:hypothetical protein